MKEIIKHLKLNTRLLKIAWQEEKILVITYYFTSFLGVIFLFLVYYFYRVLIDQVFYGLTIEPQQTIFIVLLTYLLSEYFSRFVYYTVNSYLLEYLLRSKFQNILTRKFSEKLANLDFANLEDGQIRNLIAKVEDTFTWRLHDNLRIINYIIYNIFALLLSFFIALRFNLFYFLSLAIFSAPFYYLRAKYGNAYWSIYSSHAKDTNYLWYLKRLFTNFQTLAEIKIYQTKDYFLTKMKKVQEKLINEYQKPIKKYTFYSIFSSAIIPLIIYFALRNLVFQIFLKKFSIGDFTFFLNTLFTFSGQISNILLNFGSLYENDLFVNDYFQFIDIKNKVMEKTKAIVLKDGFKEVEFKNVSFIYPGSNKLVLKDINLKINKGENIAFVGHNGAGKTTLIKLLLRFYDPDQGQILVNGYDLRHVNLNSWYEQIGILFQDFAKYYLSLEENIEIGKINKEENINKIKRALILSKGEDLLALPKGVKQILGRWFEDGQEISIGQWQKVTIARVLYRNPDLLILDEPTSNIDPQAEEDIFENLVNLYKEKNLIFISHRFSTVRKADKIFVIDKGQIIEQGKHEDLLKKNNLYAKFFKIQSKGYQ